MDASLEQMIEAARSRRGPDGQDVARASYLRRMIPASGPVRVIRVARRSGRPRVLLRLLLRAGSRAASDLVRDCFCDCLGRGVAEVHRPPGAVAVEAAAEVEVLLEVVLEREVDERPAVRGQLHRGGQPALHDREVARGEVLVELVDVGANLKAAWRGQGPRVNPGPVTTIIRSCGTARLASAKLAITRPSRSAPTPEPPTVTMHTRSSGWYPSSARSASRSANAAGSKPVMYPGS